MKKRILVSAIALFSIFIAGCKHGGGNLDEGTATDVIRTYLKSNPEFESTRIDLGEIKFRGKGDKASLENYKGFQSKGLVDMALQNQKKRFLSKDSVYIYIVTLTDKSKPYVLKQDEHKATVRALDYQLDEEKPVNLIKGDSRTARVTVTLKKQKNDFSVLLSTRETSGNFITKTYKLKFKKEEGWVMVGES